MDLRFGDAVAIDGATALVGAPNNEDNALTGAPHVGKPEQPPGGEAHVFERSDGEWLRRARFTVDGDGIDHAFGRAVALDGDTAIVGSQDNNVHGWKSGAAFVFERTAGEWHRQAMLVPDDGDRGHRFGQTVVLQGDHAVIGASAAGTGSSEPGWVYVFERSGGDWSQRGKLTPADVAASDRFRTSIALDGDRLVLGATGVGNSPAHDGGVAHVFEHRNGSWRHERTLSPDGIDAGDRFGTAVAFSGDFLLVAAPGDGWPSGTDVGAVYVFERTSDGWVRRTRYAHDGTDSTDDFGQSVALDQGRAIVSVPSESQSSGGTGAAYVYDLGHLTSTEADAPGNDFRATDPDGDGLYEDVNGDGEATPGDATVLFDRLFASESTGTEEVSRFDFNGDGSVTPGDATVLFNELF